MFIYVHTLDKISDNFNLHNVHKKWTAYNTLDIINILNLHWKVKETYNLRVYPSAWKTKIEEHYISVLVSDLATEFVYIEIDHMLYEVKWGTKIW